MIFVNTKTLSRWSPYLLLAQGWKWQRFTEISHHVNGNGSWIQVKDLDFGIRSWLVELISKGWVMASTMLFHKIFPSLFTVLARTGRNGLPDCRYYSLSTKWWFRYPWLEKNEIRFVPKVLKNGLLKILMIRTDRPIVREKARETRHRNDWSGEEEKKNQTRLRKKSNGQLMKGKAKRAENRARGRAERKDKRQTFLTLLSHVRRKHRFSLWTP